MSEARILDIDAATYHADPCPAPSLSASVAHTLIAQSPIHAWQAHPRLGGTRRAATRDMDTGSLVHALLLNRLGEAVGIVDAENFTTKAAKAERDAIRAAGKVPVCAPDMVAAEAVANILRDKLRARGIDFSRGRNEVSLTWIEDTVSGPIHARCRVDNLDGSRVLDLKTIRSAHPRKCTNHIIEYGYDVQGASNRAAVRRLPGCQGREKFELVFVEVEPPYAITPGPMDGQFRQLGDLKWERACAQWAQCLKSNQWPEYTAEPYLFSPPPWALQQENASL
jgi:hypothetical protein